MADAFLGRALLCLARGAIARELSFDAPAAPDHPELELPGATFVTLQRHERLRGCIGTLEPVRSLRMDVTHNAMHAAFGDPRFAPLDAAEYEELDVEVSLLSATTPIACASEEDLIARLAPSVDGLVLRYGRRRATFLPQVWAAVPDPREFVRELKRKAGLPGDFWHQDLVVERYTVAKWRERDPASAAGVLQ